MTYDGNFSTITVWILTEMVNNVREDGMFLRDNDFSGRCQSIHISGV